MAGSLPEFYWACQRVNGSNQGVYTGGLRPGRLLPLCTVAGGVSASLQGNRKQVESREWRNAARCSRSSGFLSLHGWWQKLRRCDMIDGGCHSKIPLSHQTGNVSHALSLSQELLHYGKAFPLTVPSEMIILSSRLNRFNYKISPVRIFQFILQFPLRSFEWKSFAEHL